VLRGVAHTFVDDSLVVVLNAVNAGHERELGVTIQVLSILVFINGITILIHI
jgi:hypothetical protein